MDRLLGEKGIPQDSAAGRNQFATLMEQRRAGEDAVDHCQLRRGWCVGSDEFRKELLAAAVQRVGPSHYGKSRQESNEEKAERIIAEELAHLD